jgi:hypothetical protein
MVSLHLAIYRPREGNTSLCTHFGPYISVLPSSFDGHPLTWRVQGGALATTLLDMITPNARRLLDKLHVRYLDDTESAMSYMVRRDRLPVAAEDFLWGWLNGTSPGTHS